MGEEQEIVQADQGGESTDFAATYKDVHPEAIVDPNIAHAVADANKEGEEQALAMQENARQKIDEALSLTGDVSKDTQRNVIADAFKASDAAKQRRDEVTNNENVAEDIENQKRA